MYWFTCWGESSIPEAIYNGRFTFIRNMSKDEARKFLSKDSVSIQKKQIAEHEYAHKEIFTLSETALLIQGMRLSARIGFRILKRKEPVIKYYQARSIFYRLMYELHEKIAHDLETAADLGNISQKYLTEILDCDYAVEKEWENNGIKTSILSRALYSFLGKKYSSHFTLIVGDWDGHNWLEENISESGLINDIGSRRNDDNWTSSLLKNISKYLQVESWAKAKEDADWQWMILKFKTEHKDWLANEPKLFDFDLYVHQAIRFSASWSRIIEISTSKRIADTIIESLSGDHIPKLPHELMKDSRHKKMINMFYLHGN